MAEDTYDPTEEEGLQGQEPEAGERPPEKPAGEAEQQPDFNKLLEDNRILRERQETLKADNDKLLRFHEEVAPYIPQLKELRNVFGGEKAPAEKAVRPEPPPEIQRRLMSSDPTVKQDALHDLFDFYSEAAVDRTLSKRAEQDQAQGQKAREKYAAQQVSKQRLSTLPQFKELMGWATPIMERIEQERQYNPKMDKDWAWLDYVPEEFYGPSFLFQLIGINVAKDPGKFKDGLALVKAVDDINKKGLGREAATGGDGSMPAKGGGGEGEGSYDEVADDLLKGSDL